MMLATDNKRNAHLDRANPGERAPEPRLYRLVAERIREFVRVSALEAGARLPPERELAASLRVSRASLREALIALELSGEVSVRGGSGLYVGQVGDNVPAIAVNSPGPFEVLAARRLIEPEYAAMAARVASDGAIDAIFAAAAAMERVRDDKQDSEQTDRQFHLAIARATGNSAVVGVVEYLWAQRGPLWQALEGMFETEELRKQTLADHRRIVHAIAMHNAAEAKHAMRAHLERVTRTLLGA